MEKIIISYQLPEYENHLIEIYNKNCDIYNSQNILTESAKTAYIENKNIYNELDLLDTFNEDIMFEMANFNKKISGLSHDIWIDEAGCERENTHYLPRLKIADSKNPRNRVPIKIDKEAPIILAGKFTGKENIDDIIVFIKSSYNDLMKVWNKEESATWFIDKYRIDKK